MLRGSAFHIIIRGLHCDPSSLASATSQAQPGMGTSSAASCLCLVCPHTQRCHDADIVQFTYHSTDQYRNSSRNGVKDVSSPPSLARPSSIACSMKGLSAKGSMAIFLAAATRS